MQIVNFHSKGPEGWAQFKSAPITSKLWDSKDQGWISWMLEHNSTVVTVGENIYEIVTLNTDQLTSA